MLNEIKISLRSLLFFIILLGGIYPFFITGIAQLFFPNTANGSFIFQNEKRMGSLLIGQPFQQDQYFWGRPSATPIFADNAENSSGSNLGPLNVNLFKQIQARANLLKTKDPAHQIDIPADLVTTSASGLDPDISPLAAYYQIPRIAHARQISAEQLQELVNQYIQPRYFFILGEPRMNVLQLNIALDQITEKKNHAK